MSSDEDVPLEGNQSSKSESSAEEELSEDEEEILEPKILPQRTTRALRLHTLIEEEDSADEEFWNQEFFAEEDKDEEFEASESEQEDVPDTDFSESETDDDDDEGEAEAKIRKQERGRSTSIQSKFAYRRKHLKPPGQPAKGRAPAAARLAPRAPVSPRSVAAGQAARAADIAAPTLRNSTRVRVEEAEKERERAEQIRPRKKRQELQFRPLTQEELLAEAAQTEMENLRSLELLQAAEEEVKKKAARQRAHCSGPYIHFHSKQVNGEALVTCEVANMLLPEHMRKRRAPPPQNPRVCAVSGRPAKYRDPLTKMPYADAEAFRQLRQLYLQQHPRRENKDGFASSTLRLRHKFQNKKQGKR